MNIWDFRNVQVFHYSKGVKRVKGYYSKVGWIPVH